MVNYRWEYESRPGEYTPDEMYVYVFRESGNWRICGYGGPATLAELMAMYQAP
jgi:hypothetical protein